MASMTERMQKAWHKYESKHDHKPTTMRQAAEWAVADGLLEPPEFQIVLDFTDDIAEREEIERMQNRRKDVA